MRREVVWLFAAVAVALSGQVAHTDDSLHTLVHTDQVLAVTFSPDGKLLASTSLSEVRVWEVSTGTEVKSLPSGDGWTYSVAFSPDGRLLAAGAGVIKLWDVATWKEVRTIAPLGGSIRSVAFSPDGKLLASSGEGPRILLGDVGTGKEVTTMTGQGTGHPQIAFSPSGKLLAASSYNGTIELWDVATFVEVLILPGLPTDDGPYVFSHDGKLLARCQGLDTLALWDVATGKLLRTFEMESWIKCMAISPDGKTLASGDDSSVVALWDIATGRKLGSLEGHHDGYMYSIAFSPDGTLIASASMDKTAKIWSVASLTVAGSSSPKASPVTVACGATHLDAEWHHWSTRLNCSGGGCDWSVTVHDLHVFNFQATRSCATKYAVFINVGGVIFSGNPTSIGDIAPGQSVTVAFTSAVTGWIGAGATARVGVAIWNSATDPQNCAYLLETSFPSY